MIRTRAVEIDSRECDRLAELYRRHATDAVRLAYLLTGNVAMAEDLAHEAFVRMFGRFRDLRQPEAFGSYLRTTIVNLTRSQFRRSRLERAYLERQTRDEPAVQATGERQEMWEALQSLPERQRAAIVLRYYEDLTEARTADVLGCRVGTVKSLVSRGLAKLREEMADAD